jgi:hypothetical protein
MGLGPRQPEPRSGVGEWPALRGSEPRGWGETRSEAKRRGGRPEAPWARKQPYVLSETS